MKLGNIFKKKSLRWITKKELKRLQKQWPSDLKPSKKTGVDLDEDSEDEQDED